MLKSSVPVLVVMVMSAACGPSKSHGNGNNGDVDGSTSGGADAPACATSMVKADQIPLDLFIMLDQSGSMSDAVAGGTKWTAVTSALGSFVQQPGLTGISVGIQYFGLPPGGATCSAITCTTTADCGAAACGPCLAGVCLGAFGGGTDSCTASDYAGAAVEIAPLPGVASMITSSMSAHSPTTSTPTSAALQGAIMHATHWSQTHVGDAVVVVLATDGDPSECDTSITGIDAIAAAGVAAMPKILTFVIGVGASLSNLNSIAAAGGTSSAFLVDTNANVNQQFLAAMNAIRHAALGCQYQIPVPTNGSPNYEEVNVVYTPQGAASQTFPYVMTKANCPANGDGWYYDNPANPMQIILCDSTCNRIQGDTTGEVDITLGCSTIIL
ncbi:MAG: hypothetical protein JWO36_6050 [Myxococcales bacterium]|nr:hypothetical protein [Myxococcales bacterium]